MLRVILQHVGDGFYNVILQVGWFSSSAKRIVRKVNISEVENTLFALQNASEITVNGQVYPVRASDISVIMTDISVANVQFGS